MPLYDFRCQKCQGVSELLISSNATAQCPLCGSENMERLLSAPVPSGRTNDLVSRARRLAASQGHFSNYSAAERKNIK
jgi:putative FmdB family regulatory protein